MLSIVPYDSNRASGADGNRNQSYRIIADENCLFTSFGLTGSEVAVSWRTRSVKTDGQPAVQPNLPEGWTPASSGRHLDPRSVGTPALVAAITETCKDTGGGSLRSTAACYTP